MWVALSREALKTESITCGICSGSIYDLISLAECHELENLSTKPCRCLCGEKGQRGRGRVSLAWLGMQSGGRLDSQKSSSVGLKGLLSPSCLFSA